MTDEFDTRLRRLLADEASRAPLVAPEWPGLAVPAGRSGRRLAPAFAAAVAVLAIVAGALVVRTAREDDRVSFGGTIFRAADEYPLRQAGDFNVTSSGLIRSESVVAVRLPDVDVTVVSFEQAFADTQVVRERCSTVPDVIRVCTPIDGPNLSFSFPPIGGERSMGIATWTTLPPGTDIVQLVQSDGVVRWQRPLAGVSAFAFAAADDDRPTLTAFDTDGSVLERLPADVDRPLTKTTKPPSWLPDGSEAALLKAQAAAMACLSRAPGAWSTCVEEGRLVAESSAERG